MKVRALKQKSKWDTIHFTIERISREDLSLILEFAREGIEAWPGNEPYQKTLELVKKIDTYVNNEDAVVRLTPLEVT